MIFGYAALAAAAMQVIEADQSRREQMRLCRELGQKAARDMQAMLDMQANRGAQPTRALECRNCGAPTHRHERDCSYCGSEQP